MPDYIRLLPDSLANQIAAGEVVQRPASAIKELLENAIDAGATEIKVIVKEAGKTLMQVVDNGKGMSPTDARMSLERHATSKISCSDDLFNITTMGFRGEALASMAAVAQVEIKSRTSDSEVGTFICVEGSEVKKQEPVACLPGTSISIKNLFYNVPARRNFLKSNAVEMKHIVEEFQRIALSYPGISMSLFQNDMEIFHLTSGKLSHRVVGIFGKSYQTQLASCLEETADMKVHGYVGTPEAARKTRGEQYFYVNGRFIKSPYLNHAVSNAYEGLIPEGTFPFYVLFINVPPARVDVNVHPTKTEIKFDDERTVYAIVRAAVRQALSTHNLTPAIDFDSDINLGTKLIREREAIRDKHYSQFKMEKDPALQHWEKLFEENPGKEVHPEFWKDEPHIQQDNPTSIRFESRINQEETPEKVTVEQGLFLLQNTYIVSQVRSGMMLIDLQAAHERILYEKYLRHMTHKSGASQQTLFPQTVSLNPGDASLVKDMSEEIGALGFMIEEFGKRDYLIKGIPADLTTGNEREIFEGLIEQFKHHQHTLNIPRKENLARSLAKRASLKSGANLNKSEMQGLVTQLFACENPNFAPNGRNTYSILSMEMIATYFTR
jgi:DNA mismatch repair protein MutL